MDDTGDPCRDGVQPFMAGRIKKRQIVPASEETLIEYRLRRLRELADAVLCANEDLLREMAREEVQRLRQPPRPERWFGLRRSR